jgi:multimeric flavodoxin WrbA
MIEADGIILGSPLFFQILLPYEIPYRQAGYVSRAKRRFIEEKIRAGVVAVRRAGAIHTFDSINHFFLINHRLSPVRVTGI